MKKLITILVIAFSMQASTIQSQTIPNNGFEQLNYDGTLSNWGNVYLWAVWVDSLGNSYPDSVVIDGQFYAPTSDANNGYTAIELRNSWDFTTNTGRAGAVAVDDDSVFSSWGLLNLVPTNATSFNPFEPINFGFYYKYLPVNGDTAFAQIALWDSLGNQLAQGELLITDPASSYTLAYAPVIYLVPGFATFYSLSISTFYTAEYGSHQPGFGTRLLVDDIGFNFVSATGINTINNNSQYVIYPNPVSSQLKIESRVDGDYTYTIRNVNGQVIKQGLFETNSGLIPVDEFKDGVYSIELRSGEKSECLSFIIRK